MPNPFIIQSDPRFDDDNPMCQGCHVRRASDVHHMQYKGMGGRHGAAKIASESAGNKIRLCRVCHAADHGLKVTESDGFSCALCPRVQSCRFGAKLVGLPFYHLRPPWTTSL